MVKKIFLVLITFNIIIVNCFAENEISFRVSPLLELPIGFEALLDPGFGAAASLDWAFWSFAPGFNLGVRAGANFLNIPAKAGDPLNLLEAKLGPFLTFKPAALERWTFRAGIDAGVYSYSRGDDSETKALFSISAGADFKVSPYFSLYAESAFTSRVFGRSQPLSSFNAAIGIRLNLSEVMSGRSRVQLEKTEQFRVFPVSWSWYENNPVAIIKITNDEPNAITDVVLSFFMENFMSEPWTFAVLPRLAPGESAQIPVTALFSEVMINLTENVAASGTIQVQYRSLGTRKEFSSPVQMPIFHRNAFSWEDDRRAAAFVSPRDGSVLLFARYAAGVVERHISNNDTQVLPHNVLYAVAMFEALRLYGINYVVVPATSYRNLSANEAALDSVSFPYQALYYRGGDCTYLSILFCSLLEALNIPTAFVTIPGHLYMAFEINDERFSGELIEIGGKRWLPVELTVPDQGFMQAWQIGARQWRNYGGEAALYPIREAWELYPYITVPASDVHLPEMPDRGDILNALEGELLKYR